MGRFVSGLGMHFMISPSVKVISPVRPEETSKKSHRHSAISPIWGVKEGGNRAWNPFLRDVGVGAGVGAGVAALVPFVTTFSRY